MLIKYKNLTPFSIFNINCASLGMQFAWSLTFANMSGIYSFLGVPSEKLSYFWLIPSVIGLLIPPFFGYISDRTATRFGKRVPYIFWGGMFGAIAMFIMPHFTNYLWIAIFQAIFIFGVNVAMHPMRALIGDISPTDSHARLYAIQTAITGIGAIVASALPWILLHFITKHSATTTLPLEIRLAFYLGALIFFVATIWTTITTKTYLPPFTTLPVVVKTEKTLLYLFRFKFRWPTRNMMILAAIQFITWIGAFCFIIYLTPSIEQIIFHLSATSVTQATKDIAERSTILAGLCFAVYMTANIVFASVIAKFGKRYPLKFIFTAAMLAGGLVLTVLPLIHNAYILLIAMLGIGISWATFNTIPFAMIANEVKANKLGLAIGIFNIAICVPQILVSLFSGILIKHIFHGEVFYILVLGGITYIIAALLALTLKHQPA
jgi:maltose/moltooligosaccharide transporter